MNKCISNLSQSIKPSRSPVSPLTPDTAVHAEPLHQAAASNDVALFQHPLENGADVTATNAANQTALHVACRTPEITLSIVNDMVDMGCDLGLKDDEGSTCMHYACASGNVGLVSILLKSPACPVNVQDNAGMTPLMIATAGNSSAIASMVINDPRSQLDVRDGNGWTVLHWAVSTMLLDGVYTSADVRSGVVWKLGGCIKRRGQSSSSVFPLGDQARRHGSSSCSTRGQHAGSDASMKMSH